MSCVLLGSPASIAFRRLAVRSRAVSSRVGTSSLYDQNAQPAEAIQKSHRPRDEVEP